jgi:hypothetical protein
MTHAQLAAKIGKHSSAVSKMLSKLRLRKHGDVVLWTEEEIDFLRKHYASHDKLWVAKNLKKTIPAVTRKAFASGIVKEKNKWTEDDVKFLRENYPFQTNKWVADKLNYSTSAIFLKAQKLGLSKKAELRGRTHKRLLWTAGDINFLRENYPVNTNKWIVDKLKKYSINAILKKADELGIRKTVEFRGRPPHSILHKTKELRDETNMPMFIRKPRIG